MAGETLEELKKQAEDIQLLLSSLEDTYAEAAISEENYNEVKQKNIQKLDEINAKIAKLEPTGSAPKAEATSPPAESHEEQSKRGRKLGSKNKPHEPEPSKPDHEKQAPPAEKKVETKPDSPPPAEEPKKEGKDTAEPTADELAVVPEEFRVKEPTGEEESSEASAEKPDTKPKGPPPKGTEKLFAAEEIRELLKRFMGELKPEGVDLAPKIEKLKLKLEKMDAVVAAFQEQTKSSGELSQRINEEIGELRSSVTNAEGRLSEMEMKVKDAQQAIDDLRPDRFTKIMKEQQEKIKQHDGQLEKNDDLTSTLIRRISNVEDVLKTMGSLESIASLSKNISRRLTELENKEKRMTKMSDRIDSIFAELNKRLEEFMFYKVKQDTMDEMSQEMMKNMDEINAKLEDLVTKEELESVRSEIASSVSSAEPSPGLSVIPEEKLSPKLQKLYDQKQEEEQVMTLLEEQHSSKAMSDNEYEKARQKNMEKLKQIEKKIAKERGGSGQSSEPAEIPEPGEKTSSATEDIGEEMQSMEAMESEESVVEAKPESAHHADHAAETPASESDMMLQELEESLRNGLISREAYEKTKKLLSG